MATKTQSVTRRVMFSYDPNTTESVVTGTVVMDDGSVVNVTVNIPDCPEPDICDCDDLTIGEIGPGTDNRIVWNDTEFTGNCEGGSERVRINGTSGNTPVTAIATITYLPNDGNTDAVRTSRVIISGSPVSVKVTVPACAEKPCGCNNVTLSDVDENCNCSNVTLSDIVEGCDCSNVVLTDVIEGCDCDSVNLND